MARTGNRYLKINISEEDNESTYRVGNYLRLSVDSDYTGSDSLENQRQLAKEYVDRFSDLVIVKEYIDDGKSGTNFDRPEFVKMITDIKQGVINCVIVKDLSRFGREYIEAGNYIEKVFPFLGVRFISIVDRYDSADANCDNELLLISLKNLMHEMYARDISKKVSSTFQMKQEKGIFYRSTRIPYGYKMDEDNENYCIDEPAAEIVKEIFSQYTNGVSRYKICNWLYEHHVSTPLQYLETGKIIQQDDAVKLWPSSTIARILKNPVYIGNVLRHKTEQSFFEGKENTAIPEDEQLLIVNNHPSVVSQEMFESAQKRLDMICKQKKEDRKDSELKRKDVVFEGNVFREKIFCGDCKVPMTRSVGYRTVDGELERYKIFKCTTHIQVNSRCDTKWIEEKVLCEILLVTIQKQIHLIKGIKKLIDKDFKSLFEDKLLGIKKEKERIRNGFITLQQDYLRTYTQYTERKITTEFFQEFRHSYMKREKSYKTQLKMLETEEKKIKKLRVSIKKMIEEWLVFDKAGELTEDMINTCVERIEVFKDNRLEIKLRYQDCFMAFDIWRKEGALAL